ncbi:MAG: 30S ribosomal protein S12 methylthiotransferase RimO [Candidatus Omnitrophica bacterium]|nr:30S ribosomal protein S12 methylthiotransferase RimO [Candidatus Omnitrophota bacterium]
MLSPEATKKSIKWRVGMLSLGCPKTLVDSEVVLGKLDPRKYSITPTVADCDIALINTCAFIEDAQKESVDQILKLLELKKEGEVQKVIVLGCLYQRFPKDLQRELAEVDAFVGTGEYSKIPEIVERITQGKTTSEIGIPGYLYTSGEKRVQLTPSFSRYIKISEGCDHACSFCVIPSFRGGHKSRELTDVVKEAELLVEEGARELVLTGQDTTFYGYDLIGRYQLPELLSKLNEISDLRWIRVLYAYPSLVTNQLIQSIASLEKVCHYLDMPLQHISDRVLKSMRRGTSKDSIKRLIDKLRNQIPDIAIRTTFIVGYPGEREEDFQDLLDFVNVSCFERLGIFCYSQEQGSLAAKLPGQVPDKVKRERLKRGMLLQQEVSFRNNERLIGKKLEVLVECYDKELHSWLGRTYMDAPEVDGQVFLKGSKRLKPGEFVTAQITETREYDLVGNLT